MSVSTAVEVSRRTNNDEGCSDDSKSEQQFEADPLKLKCQFIKFHKEVTDGGSMQYKYTIQMICETNQSEWTIVKRYSDFRRLNSLFTSDTHWKRFVGVQKPDFPGKVMCFREEAKLELANKRLVSLDIYLKELISRSVFLSLPDIRAFLQMPLPVRELAHVAYDKATPRKPESSMKNEGADAQTESIAVRCFANETKIDTLYGTVESLMETVHSLNEEVEALKSEIADLMDRKTEIPDVIGMQSPEINALGLWLRDEVKLPQYFGLFVNNGFENMLVVQQLDLNDLEELGIEKKGHRLQIVLAIAKLKLIDPVKPESANNANGGTLFL